MVLTLELTVSHLYKSFCLFLVQIPISVHYPILYNSVITLKISGKNLLHLPGDNLDGKIFSRCIYILVFGLLSYYVPFSSSLSSCPDSSRGISM